MGHAANAEADKEDEEDTDDAGWHVEKCSVLGAESQRLDQGGRVGCYHTAGYGLLDLVSRSYALVEIKA